MAEGVDYAFSSPDPAGLYAAGKRFAMRYVGPGTDDKLLHAAERDQIWAAGLDIVLLAEGYANGALGGFPVGVQHATLARDWAAGLGAPVLPLYFAVDFDVTSAQWPTVAAYLSGCATVVGDAQVGIYGGIRAMQWAARDGVAAWFFQTYAWSAGAWFPGNHVEQYQNGVALAGGVVDLCRAPVSDFGQWSSPGKEDDMTVVIRDPATGAVWVSNYVTRRHVDSQEQWTYLRGAPGMTDLGNLGDGQSIDWFGVDVEGAGIGGGHPVLPPGPTAAEIAKAVNDDTAARMAA